MKKNKLCKTIEKASFILVTALILVWGCFYLYTNHYLQKQSMKDIERISTQIINDLQTQFLHLENISFSMAQNQMVKDLILEEDVMKHYKAADGVNELFLALQQQSLLTNKLIIFSNKGEFCHFSGTISNTALAKVYYLLEDSEVPTHLVLEMDGKQYIGYCGGIYEEETVMGYVVFLISKEKLDHLFLSYGAPENVKITLVADDVIIASNDSELQGITHANATYGIAFTQEKKIGITSFKILVFAGNEYFRATRNTFLMAMMFTTILIAVLIWVGWFILNKHFLKPMFTLMKNVEEIDIFDSSGMLAPVEGSYFDNLVDKINIMLQRLDENTKALFKSNFKLHRTEIARQKSIIASLKKQINAHFTVNVLNSIKLLVGRGEMEKTSEMCDGLCYLLQYANSEDEYIDVLEEIFMLQKYIKIMDIRYYYRFIVKFDIDESLDVARIPRMLLQPVVENSIVHGFRDMQCGGVCKISARERDGNIFVSVEDNGTGMEQEQLESLLDKFSTAVNQEDDAEGIENIALFNVHRRILTYYGESSGLQIESKVNEGTKVTMKLGAQQ